MKSSTFGFEPESERTQRRSTHGPFVSEREATCIDKPKKRVFVVKKASHNFRFCLMPCLLILFLLGFGAGFGAGWGDHFLLFQPHRLKETLLR